MVVLTQKHIMVGSTLGLTSNRSFHPAQTRLAPTQALFGFGKKKEKTERELAKEEQIRIQQEVLARRKNNSWQKDVKERRAKASRYLNDPEFKKICDAENRAKFKAAREAEGPEPKFGIIIPIIPVGLPEYDGGERFDLRLPYVDNGWVDEDADFGKQIARFFGMGKKTNEESGMKEDGKGKKKNR